MVVVLLKFASPYAWRVSALGWQRRRTTGGLVPHTDTHPLDTTGHIFTHIYTQFGHLC